MIPLRATLTACTALCLWIICRGLAFIAIVLGCVLAQPGPGAAQESAPWTPGATDLAPFAQVAQITTDAGGALAAYRDGQLAPVAGRLIDFGFDPQPIWAAIPLVPGQPGEWVLTVDVPSLARLEVWFALPGADPSPVYATTHDAPFGDRPLSYRGHAVPLMLPAGGGTLLVGYRSEQATQLPLFLETPSAWATRVRAEDVHNAILVALTAGIALVSTAYLVALGFRPTGYFGVYIALSLLYLMHTDGYAFQLFWPGAPGWNQGAVPVIGLALVAAGVAFARAFTDAPRDHPWLNVALMTAFWTSLIFLVASVFLLHETWFKSAALTLVLGLAALQISTAWASMRRGRPGAYFFLAGVLAVCSAVVFGVFGYLNPGLFNQDVAGHVGRYALVVETLAFSSAIFRRIRDIQKDRDRAASAELQLSRDKIALYEAVERAKADHAEARDIAERRRAQLAMTAHDIRQPLTSLRMALLRLNRNAPDRAGEIAQSFDYLDALVDRSLADTTPDAPAQVPPARHGDQTPAHGGATAPEVLPVQSVLGALDTMFRAEAEEKGLTLRVHPSAAQVRIRPVEVLRILSNLVSNAVKYTAEGRVVLGVRRDGAETLRIEVHDTGPGMDPQTLRRMENAYTRGEEGAGTGLGLFGARQMAEAAGLRFAVQSTPGAGTVASLTLRRA
ncbi:MAG: sensor histidine kinase [Pseudomonadota bacterium]